MAAVRDLIDVAVGEVNLANDQSGVPIVFRRVGELFEAPAFVETGSMDKDLDLFARADDQTLQEIHSKRDAARADIAVLIADEGDMASGKAAMLNADEAHAFLAIDCRQLGGTIVLAHELGHLMGLMHDDDDSDDLPPYAHGYRHPETADQPTWATIMAKPCDGAC